MQFFLLKTTSPLRCCCEQVLHAFERWHAQHTAKVRTLLEVQDTAGPAEVMAQPIASVITHLAELFRLKQTVVRPVPSHMLVMQLLLYVNTLKLTFCFQTKMEAACFHHLLMQQYCECQPHTYLAQLCNKVLRPCQ